MTLCALEHGYVTEVYWMFKRFVGLVAGIAVAVRQISEIHRMAKGPHLHVLGGRPGRIEDHCMADVAIVTDYFPGIAYMLAIVTTETT